MLKARPHPDNCLLWFVSSEENPDKEHTVNIYEDSCTCEDFKFRVQPKLAKGHSIKAWNCKHYRRVRNILADAMIERLKMQMREEIENAT